MKRFFLILFAASVLVGCSSSSSSSKVETNPLIEAFLREHIANPDTYKPGKSEVVEQGTIDVQNAFNWRNLPADGKVDVVVVRHEFSNVDISGKPTDNAFLFYMNPDQDVLYYAHKDKGVSLFNLE